MLGFEADPADDATPLCMQPSKLCMQPWEERRKRSMRQTITVALAIVATLALCAFVVADKGPDSPMVLPSMSSVFHAADSVTRQQHAPPNQEEELTCTAERKDATIAMKLLVDLRQMGAQHAMVLSATKEKNLTIDSLPPCKGKAVQCFIPPPCLAAMAGIVLSGTLLLEVFLIILAPLGFAAESVVVASSVAAAWQSTIGDVESGSLFAMLQHIGGTGAAGVLEVFTIGLAVDGAVAAAAGALCVMLPKTLGDRR